MEGIGQPLEQTLEHYRLTDEIGSGGMATVYRGEDLVLKREVAVKILHPHLSKSEQNQIRFQREAQAVAALKHRNIIEVYDYERAPVCFIVSEFVHGPNLGDYVKEHGVLFPEMACLLLYEVADALKHAHSKGVLHRDIKPENIIISREGVIKVVDFGIAHVQGLETMTMTGALMGSPSYMAPETLDGHRGTFRTDIYSLGVVFYQITTGHLPFEADTPVSVLKAISEGAYAPAAKSNPVIGREISALIDRMLARDPKDRMPSMSVLQKELASILARVGIDTSKGVSDTLQKYFDDPAGQTRKVRERVMSLLLTEGRRALREGRHHELAPLAERLLAIDRGNADALALLEGGHNTRLPASPKWLIAAASVLLLIGAAIWALKPVPLPGEPDAPLPADHPVAPREGAVERLPDGTDALAEEAAGETLSEQPEEAMDEAPQMALLQPEVAEQPVAEPIVVPGEPAPAPEDAEPVVRPVTTPPPPPEPEPAQERRAPEPSQPPSREPEPRQPPPSEPAQLTPPTEREPAPPPPEVIDPGRVEIRIVAVDPESGQQKTAWANVRIDGGEPERVWPRKVFSLEPGLHEIVVANPNFQEQRLPIRIVSGKDLRRTVTLRPVSEMGTLRLKLDNSMSGVEYFTLNVDGRTMTAYDGFEIEVLPGKHIIGVAAEGYQSQQMTLVFKAGETKLQPIGLIPAR